MKRRGDDHDHDATPHRRALYASQRNDPQTGCHGNRLPKSISRGKCPYSVPPMSRPYSVPTVSHPYSATSPQCPVPTVSHPYNATPPQCPPSVLPVQASVAGVHGDM
ncbi:hypothetical protein EYF80_052743 [Liparis tanakae]|uniref:Uncharacterized protein n=1 Tax=Liparis tanakae TaxID=230148 RepID=A0A4Z2F8E3_9TELE|nr:hypothetical protein EYF80_052743 [Liparis tanakae]